MRRCPLRRDPRNGRRTLAVLAWLVPVLLAGACGDPPGPKTPTLDLTYAPSPPVPGQRLAIRMTGTDLGVVDLFQGSELLARVVNPLDGVVPPELYVYQARNAEPPRAVVYDSQGNRTDVAGRPGGVVVPKAPADGGAEGGEPKTFTRTCRGFADVTANGADAGPTCGPSGLAVALTVRNATAGFLEVSATTFEAGVCKTLSLVRIGAGEDRVVPSIFDNQTVTLERGGGGGVSRFRIAAGEAGPCNLLVE